MDECSLSFSSSSTSPKDSIVIDIESEKDRFQDGKYATVLGKSLVNKKSDTEVQFLKSKLVNHRHLVSVLVAVKCTKKGQVDEKMELV
jgi:hypothetical protein